MMSETERVVYKVATIGKDDVIDFHEDKDGSIRSDFNRKMIERAALTGEDVGVLYLDEHGNVL